MKFFYNNDSISEKELKIAIPSMIIGVGVLSLPSGIASVTIGSDGWISILIAGLLQIVVVWMIAKVASRFPGQGFLAYTSKLISKPVAVIFTFIFAVFFICVTAYDIRMLGHTSEQYLFKNTPVEVVMLAFLLVVVYAVSGSRAGLFRLNLLFLPVIIVLAVILFLLSLKIMDVSNLQPAFQTDINGHLKGIYTSALSYIGISIVFFYTSFVSNPKNVPKVSIIGVTIPVIIYILVFLNCILVFGQIGTSHLLFPTVDLAKRIDLPGGMLERTEALFFTVWTMGVFTTAIMAFDVAIIALQSVFKQLKKMHIILFLSPLIYFIGALPKNTTQIILFGDYIATSMYIYGYTLAVLLFIIVKIRKGKTNEKKTT